MGHNRISTVVIGTLVAHTELSQNEPRGKSGLVEMNPEFCKALETRVVNFLLINITMK
jgi:hypothetical protein